MKDDKIKSVIDDYLSGTSLPKVSLDDAKNLIQDKKRNNKRRKKMWLSIASLACALVVVLSTYLIVDSLTVKYYDMASLKQASVTFGELNKDSKYSKYISSFVEVENSANANIDYFVYYDGDNVTLIRLDIKAITHDGAEKATIYIEFTDNTHTCESFKNYYELSGTGKYLVYDYKYNSEEVADEWVSSAYFEHNKAKYFVNVESPSEASLEKYLEIIF